MMKLQGCPKCHGDLYVGQDIFGSYLSCIQCGQDYFLGDDPAQAGPESAPARSGAPPDSAELELAA